jgi:hypothetical protein
MMVWLKQTMTLIPQRLRFWLPLKRRNLRAQKVIAQAQLPRIQKLSLLVQLRDGLNVAEAEVLKP